MENIQANMFTHDGSLELQDQLENYSIILPTILLHEVEENFKLVCLDTYGNYVCQKIIPYLSCYQIYRFIACISNEFDLMATSIPGSCIISVLMNHSVRNSLCKNALLKAFEHNVNRIICDPQGSHLLQLSMELYETHDIAFVLNCVFDNFYTISTDKFGCCIVKKILEIATDKDYYTIFSQVYTNLVSLANDQFGNYIIQYYFELRKESECIQIIDKIKHQIKYLSKEKYGSNVLETILEYCSYSNINDDLINILTESEETILQLANDKYGNYVLQKCLEISDTMLIDRNTILKKTWNIIELIQNETVKQKIIELLMVD